VIVASILLAFAIDRGYESFESRSEETAILAGLRADFVANRAALEAHLEWHDRWAAGIATALEYTRPGSTVGVDDRTVLAFEDFFANPTLDPSTATLDVVESSGRGRLLGDPELRLLIAEWRVHTDDAVDQQAGLQRNRDLMLWPALTALDLRTPDGARAAIDPPDGLPGPEALRAAGLPAILDLHSALLVRTRGDWVEVLDATVRVLERLDALGAR
jgi:hypothetical protein